MSYKIKKYLLITATLTAVALSLDAQDELQTPRLEAQEARASIEPGRAGERISAKVYELEFGE